MSVEGKVLPEPRDRDTLQASHKLPWKGKESKAVRIHS